MGMDQTLYVQYDLHDNKTYDGCPIDIPLSCEPSCKRRHFENVSMIFCPIIDWCRANGIDRYMRSNRVGEVSEDCGYIFIEVRTSALLTLRDELRKIEHGEKSTLCRNDEMYEDDDGEQDRAWAKEDADKLDKYLHEDDVRFFYECSW